MEVGRSLEEAQATADGNIHTVESDLGEEPVLVEQLAHDQPEDRARCCYTLCRTRLSGNSGCREGSVDSYSLFQYPDLTVKTLDRENEV